MDGRPLLLAAALALGLLPSPAGSAQTFRTGVQTVAIHTTVVDREGRLVTDLTRDDFEIRDNGRPVDISLFSNEPQPITVAVMLDMSGSMLTRYLYVRKAADHFIDALLPHDRARIGTFGDEIFVSPLLTGDKATLKRVVAEEVWPGGGTPLWTAVDAAMTSIASEPGRRVVLTLTDGADTGALPGWPKNASAGDVRKRATDTPFMMYSIGMEGPGLVGDMTDLAEETGGGHFVLKLDADLPATFARVAEELRRQYLLGFTPPALDGKRHRLEVRVTRQGLRARARRNYLAVPDR